MDAGRARGSVEDVRNQFLCATSVGPRAILGRRNFAQRQKRHSRAGSSIEESVFAQTERKVSIWSDQKKLLFAAISTAASATTTSGASTGIILSSYIIYVQVNEMFCTTVADKIDASTDVSFNDAIIGRLPCDAELEDTQRHLFRHTTRPFAELHQRFKAIDCKESSAIPTYHSPRAW